MYTLKITVMYTEENAEMYTVKITKMYTVKFIETYAEKNYINIHCRNTKTYTEEKQKRMLQCVT